MMEFKMKFDVVGARAEVLRQLPPDLAQSTTLWKACAEIDGLRTSLAKVESDKDEVLFTLAEMKGRLGQYEAQYAHDHNLWMASRYGKLEAERDRYRDALTVISTKGWHDIEGSLGSIARTALE